MNYKDNNFRWLIKFICKSIENMFVLLALFTFGYYIYCRDFNYSLQLFFFWKDTDNLFFMFARILSGVLAISEASDQ